MKRSKTPALTPGPGRLMGPWRPHAQPLVAGPTKGSPFGIGLAVPVNLTPPFNLGLGLSGKYWMNGGQRHRRHPLRRQRLRVAWRATTFGTATMSSAATRAKHLPLYFGPGASVTTWSAGPYQRHGHRGAGKLGVDYLFREPFDLYAEAIP